MTHIPPSCPIVPGQTAEVSGICPQRVEDLFNDVDDKGVLVVIQRPLVTLGMGLYRGHPPPTTLKDDPKLADLLGPTTPMPQEIKDIEDDVRHTGHVLVNATVCTGEELGVTKVTPQRFLAYESSPTSWISFHPK
eukprot:CAMPEP_0184322738 /NCGR_PEP_ID=MMETSP1049-20130417/126317_1 /TAXON_ID=77928 /ORGANISM="Proteomonas sulcata, Strain CCMP704" /LENGTH=134 /DNA_ID=CAMNT_0026643977 /DNA_START=59 /DNA_END=463 /DNA_ORIENTATION=-